MKIQKHIKLLCVSTTILFSLLACKKENKELTTAEFHIYNPVSGIGMEGVEVKIIEQKDVTKPFQLTSEYETKVIWTGLTDENGKAKYSFPTYKNDKYTYWESANMTQVECCNNKLLSRPEFMPLKKQETNSLDYKFTIPATFKLHYKNVNCLNANDIFKIRYRWQFNSTQSGWSNWSLDQFGCYDSGVSSIWNSHNDYFITEYEVERNGITNTYLDTFYINPNSVDTFNVFY